LSEEVLKKIVVIQLDLIKERLMRKGIFLEVSEKTLSHLAKEGFNPEYGARPLKRLIQNKILNPVAKFIITRSIDNGGVVMVEMKKDEPIVELKKVFRRQANNSNRNSKTSVVKK
ncbi:MAG: hypothetical protein WCX70_02860, partial [Candidatus Paceibacterota bacterium]